MPALRTDGRIGTPVGVWVSVLLLAAALALDLSVRLGLAAYFFVPAVLVAIGACAWLGTQTLRARQGLDRAHRQLREAQGRMSRQTRMLEIAGEVGHFGGWAVDVRNDSVQWSDEVARIHGLAPESMHDVDTGISYYVREDQPRIAAAFARCVRDGTPFNEELQLVRQNDGELRWVNAIGRAERDEQGEVVFVRGALQDVTDRIDAQVSAEASRRRLDTLGARMPFVIWTAHADGALDYLSEEFWRVTGILPGDALGDAWLEALHPDDRARALTRWGRSVATGEPYLIEFRVRALQAGHRWHYARATPERNAAGEVVRWWGSSIDIHDMRVLQDEATALADELSDTLESIGDAVLTLDTDGRVTSINPQGERLLRRSRSELLGRDLWTVFPEAIGSIFQREFDRALTERRPVTFGAAVARLDLDAEISAHPHDGGLTVYFRDVSERRSLGPDGTPYMKPPARGTRREQTDHPGEGVTVLVAKDAVTEALRARGDHDRAAQADTALPRKVDTESDAGLLHQFDLNVSEVEATETETEVGTD